ncbi:MAG TPA: molybdenum cofactor guanylyltransferase, partial [Nitrospirota bacterium]|nr:molybdenum cofactor guanylyltransferase [Nitrospirota bacterium]
MAGIVLAGGENRRMGADKAFLKLAGVPMIEHVMRSLKAVCRDIIIVTNSPQLYKAYRVSVVSDAFNLRGPLTGIYSGLLKSADEYNFVVACDMPFLNPRLLAFMGSLAAGYDVVVPAVGSMIEPLHAVYRKGLLPVIETQIMRYEQQIRVLFEKQRVRYVAEEEIDRFDPARKS